MSFDENERFYDENTIDQSAWQQPRPEPTPMMSRRKSRRTLRIIGIVLLAALLQAATGGIYYAVQRTDLDFQKTDTGFSLTIGSRSKTPQETSEPPAEPSSEPDAATDIPKNAPAQEISTDPDRKLELHPPVQGAQTRISDETGALSLQEIYERVSPSAVSITVQTTAGSGSGSGIIMSEDGYIITNHHVIENALSITVLTSDDELYEAALVGSDEASDLAVLKVDAQRLPAAEFGDSSGLRVGDSVVAIGDPLGMSLRGTMTNGIISAINRDLDVGERTMTLIQTNAALNNGNSGGPLINCYGQVIGINTMKMSTTVSRYASSSATIEGLGFAIPISVAKPLIDEIIAKGYVSGRPALGVSYEVLPARFQLYYRLPSGLYITEVLPTSDACAKGIAPGDILTAINGVSVSSAEDFNSVKNQFTAGDTVTVTIYRSGQFYDVPVVLIDRATGY